MNNSKADGPARPVIISNGLVLFLFLLLLGIGNTGIAAPVLVINDSANKFPLGKHVDILDNPEGIILIDDILNTELRNGFAPLNLSSRSALNRFSHHFWLRFSVHNSNDQTQSLWLKGNHNAIATLDLYQQIPDRQYQVLPDALFQHRDWAPILKEIIIPAHTTATFFIDTSNIAKHSLNIELIRPTSFLPAQINRSIIFSCAIGIMAMLTLLNLFIAYYRKSGLLLFHGGFILANIGVQIIGLGIPNTLLNNFGEWQHSAITLLFFLSTTSCLFCAREYIKHNAAYKGYEFFLNIMHGGNIICAFVVIFLAHTYTSLMLLPFLLTLPAIVGLLVKNYKQQNDVMALWLSITVVTGSILFITLLSFSANPYNLDLLTDPCMLYLFVTETVIFTALLMAREYLGINDEFKKKLLTHVHATRHRAQNDLLQEFSGDMQTSLSGILGMADLLKSSSLTAEQHSKVDAIKNSGRALLNKIADIHHHIQLEQNSESIRQSPFELSLLLENCISNFQLAAEAKNIELILQIQPDVPEVVKGDEYRLRQIIIHLLGNAIKNTEQGEVLVKLSKNATDNDTVYFSVLDTGQGIASDHIIHIARSIQTQLDTDKKQGLNTVSQLLKQLKSELLINSIEGEGSAFSFSLHLPGVENTAHKNTPLDNILKYKTLLIVDDNHTSCKVLKQQAISWGIKVSEAHSGQEALAMYRAKHNLGEIFDAIILDYNMPQISGIAVAEKITLEAKENQPVIIMLAGLSQSPPEYIAKQAGVDVVLNKPVSQKLLKLTLCNLLHIHEKKTSGAGLSSDKKLRILVADDNDVIRSVISKMMESLHVDYKMVSDGKLAVDAIKKENFDVILMDCEMPFMNGFEATEKIHQWQRERHQDLTPVIALTAYTLGEHKTKSIAAGMVDYLEKPINMAELEAVLKRHQA